MLESFGFFLEDKADDAGAMVLEAMLEDCQALVLDDMKIEHALDVTKEKKASPLSSQRTQSFVGDYRPTFCEGKRY